MPLEEITASYLSELYSFDDTIIAECESEQEGRFKLKITDEEHELLEGMTYRWYGKWVRHYKYGRQFHAQNFIQAQPHDERGIVAYLTRAPKIGKVTARKLWKKYGSDAVRTLRESPDKVARELDARGFNAECAELAAAYLEQEKDFEDTNIALVNLLAGRGFPRTTGKRAIKLWGVRAEKFIQRNPYLLTQFPGVGFAKADNLYLELGKNPAAVKRQTLCLLNEFQNGRDGHTWYGTQFCERTLAEKISSTEITPVAALRLGLRTRVFVRRRDASGTLWVTSWQRAQSELNVAVRVAELGYAAPSWPTLDGIDISDHQREQLDMALRGRIGIFSGCPGTGKTFTAARLIGRITNQYGPSSVAVAAPTGKAAVRISEALSEYGIDLHARTIHSLLEVGEVAGSSFAFRRGADNPLGERFIVIDEASMVDCSLMASLLEALSSTAHLLLVGDLQQLPPVGYGAPLRDMLAAKVPNGELREIRRNSGAIVETCAAIRDARPISAPSILDRETGQNLAFKQVESNERAASFIVRLIQVIRGLGEHHPVWETQVIVAVNEKSPLSRVALNKQLQSELNAQNGKEGSKFWEGDKIVCLKNNFLPASGPLDEELLDEAGMVRRDESKTNADVYVANGELGRVVSVYPNRLIARFSNPEREVVIPRGPDHDLGNFDLGYAISCHKSQGSEWPIVIVALDEYYGARSICDRSWIYTAISRAKTICLLVGKMRTLRDMVRRQKIGSRKTFLVDRIAEERRRVEEIARQSTNRIPLLGSEVIKEVNDESGDVDENNGAAPDFSRAATGDFYGAD